MSAKIKTAYNLKISLPASRDPWHFWTCMIFVSRRLRRSKLKIEEYEDADVEMIENLHEKGKLTTTKST